MEHRIAPLRTPADLERAVAEARTLVNGLEQAGPETTKRFDELLRVISEYRGDRPPPSPEDARRQALDGHLKAFGSRWSQGRAEGRPDHWSSMVGGDVNPRRRFEP
jgi:hypothetical protein